jgi:squalene-hopene/tetraprenyl-beta-curcumene cyclase
MFGCIVSSRVAAVLGTLIQLAVPAGNATQAADAVPPREIRKAVERGTAYLEAEGVAWMKKQRCASCHHVPMMVWALNEARQRKYPVNEKALGEVTSWALAERNHAQVFPDLPVDKTRTETDYLGPRVMALAVGASTDRDEAAETARHRLLAHAVGQQAKDGSWHANSGGRPPVHASREVQTSWVVLALSPRPARADAEDSWATHRKLAADWLARNPPADSHQAVAMRLLVHERLGKPAGDAEPLLASLLRLQNEDGGWSQTPRMTSDAFATGLSLYVLSGQRGERVDAAIGRAQAFLVNNQQPDGSWSMTSRPAEPSGPGPARDLRPIKFVGTAWATIGLVRSGGKGGAVNK